MNSYLKKCHFEGTRNEVSYLFKSFSLNFKNLNTNYKFSLKNLDLMIPFAYMPIVYSLDIDSFICFIVLTTKFNEKLTEITFSEEKVYEFLDSFENFKEITKEKLIPINHFNLVKFDWILPNFMFEVSIKMPCIEVIYVKYNIKINKILDYNITLDLFNKNFANWDITLLNYLNQIKNFRQMINKSFSKLNLLNIFPSQKLILENQGYKYTEKNLDENIIHDQYFNEKNIIFNIGITDKYNVNKLFTLKSYNVVCENKFKKLNIDLNFKQFRLIEKISESFNMDIFIKKLLIIESKEPFLTLDIQYFDYIDENFFKFLKKPKNNFKLVSNTEVNTKVK